MVVVEEKVAHFVIEGAAMVRTARDLLLSERPAHAWRFIAQGLIGDANTGALAEAILDGKKTLTGDSDSSIEPADEDPVAVEDYLKTVRFIYAGRTTFDRVWFRPKAYVSSYGPEDIGGADEIPVFAGLSSLRRFAVKRTAYYARRGEIVVEVLEHPEHPTSIKGRLIIFEPCGELPHWWQPRTTPGAALSDFIAAGRRLEERHCEIRTPKKSKKSKVSPLSREELDARWAREQAEDDAREAAYRARLEELRVRIVEQAGDDWFELIYEAGKDVPAGSVRVPRAPFVCWALSRTSLRTLAPEWKIVSPMGMKMMLDEPYHTDWMIGAGLALESYHSHPAQSAATHEMSRLQEQYGQFECAVLVGGHDVIGEVGKDIVVLPNLKPDYLPEVIKARAVITQVGGQLAHLALVAMEKSIPMLLVPDAIKRFRPGMKLHITPDEGKIREAKDETT